MTRKDLKEVYNVLYAVYGPQNWWPAESPFEVIIGAILTQNTAWTNVEKAIGNLKTLGMLNPADLFSSPSETIAQVIRPSGYYNRKTVRLKSFMSYFSERYNLDIGKMAELEIPVIRDELLSVKGIGEETADSIILYALNRATFVIDAYTKRIFSRTGVFTGDEKYFEMKDVFEMELEPDVKLYNEYHALIVKHAKMYCTTKPDCRECPLKGNCDYFAEDFSVL